MIYYAIVTVYFILSGTMPDANSLNFRLKTPVAKICDYCSVSRIPLGKTSYVDVSFEAKYLPCISWASSYLITLSWSKLCMLIRLE